MPLLLIATSASALAEDKDNSGWWAGADKSCDRALSASASSATPGLKSKSEIVWDKEGHFSTTATVAKLAGWSDADAGVLACYSQLPDAQSDLMAVTIGNRDFFKRGEYHHLIMDTLHSLHGGRHQGVLERRTRLATMIKENAAAIRNSSATDEEQKASAWQAGYLIHAFGDSYAHVKGRPERLSAYGDRFGHAADGHEPDKIAKPENFARHEEFVRALYEALKNENAKPERLEEFLTEMRKAAEKRHEYEVRKVLAEFKV